MVEDMVESLEEFGSGDLVPPESGSPSADSGFDDGIRVANDPVEPFRTQIRSGDVVMFLVNSEIWELMHPFGHEMLINTNGRYLRPDVRVELQGLKPDKMYSVRARIGTISPTKLAFRRGRWDYTTETAQELSIVYEHPESPKLGQYWLDAFIVFDSIKVYSQANLEEESAATKLVLDTRRKYQLAIEVEELQGATHHFEFEQLQFISVTAWHSAHVKKFKVKPHQYANPTRMKPVDEVDAAIGSRSAPPVFRVVNHEVSNELNPNAINILCKPPASTSSSRIHKIGIIEDSGSAPVSSAPTRRETEQAVRLLNNDQSLDFEDDFLS
ncbi:T-box transcription factor mls-1 [Galendromus occidentalis]|uniref:T-box transcription factor mls-1 n=1 Tax=Galendromus occidentalis TaxID=34638 RepID=A0AAJ6VZU9_9ACAR|nr:T-box transcription factor mls-1 [Galendromus occidentalis]